MKVIKWIVLIWSVCAIPYAFVEDSITTFFGLLYLGLIIGLMIMDLRKA